MAEPEAAASHPPATLELNALSLRRAGSALLSALSLRSDAQRIGLIGDWSALFQALTGQAQLSAGRAWILGCDLEHALARGVVGFAACDPVLPGSFSVLEYLRHAARLSHGSAARAVTDTKRVLEDFGLDAIVTHRLGQLAPFQRRALGIACAALTSPPVLCLEAPLRGLDAEPADYVARLCSQAAKQTRLIVSAELPSSPSPERALLDDCHELFVLHGGARLSQGSPAQIFEPGTRYLLTVKGGPLPEFSAALRGVGCLVEERERAGSYLVELCESGNTDVLLDAALACGLVVLELTPVLEHG
jgi:ABC-type multidrug transport system ATPase subunit